ncbi:MAG: hypothetical protein C0425_01300 [Chlorobiaceae bacterium]|nr:hypothetical protein [Chlorobiaceae bacterium]MBA4308958.1 hypothetical protein [Chlorobiaceae bacterium]
MIDDFIRYHENMMNVEDKINFEKKLESDLDLKNEYNSFVLNLSFLNELNKPLIPSGYSETLIPRFRQKLESKNKFYSFTSQFAFGLSTFVVATIVFLFYNINPSFNFSEQSDGFQNISQLEKEELFEDYFSSSTNIDYESVQNEIELIDKIANNKLNEILILSHEERMNIIRQKDLNEELLMSISDEEADAIYQEIITKKIL